MCEKKDKPKDFESHYILLGERYSKTAYEYNIPFQNTLDFELQKCVIIIDID